MKEKLTLKSIIDFAGKIIGLAAALFAIIAGSLFSYYFLSINYFPKAFSTDHTLIFFAVPVVFGFSLCIVILSLLSLGLGLRPFWLAMQYVIRRVMSKFGTTKAYVDNNEEFTIAKAQWHHLGFIILGFVILIGFGSQGIKPFLLLLSCCFGCALFWSQFEINLKEISSLKAKKKLSKKKQNRLLGLKKNQQILVGGLILIPLILGGVTPNLINATMSYTNIRTDNATVHVKQPYLEVLESTGAKGTDSFFGSDYKQFKDINVLVDGFGSNTVLSHARNPSSKPIVVPQDYINVL